MTYARRHQRQFLKVSLPFVFCLTMTTAGCEGPVEDVESANLFALGWGPAKSMKISVTDSRTLSNVTVTLQGETIEKVGDDMQTVYYDDWEDAGGNLPGTSASWKEETGMTFNRTTDNELRRWYHGGSGGLSYSNVTITVPGWQAGVWPYFMWTHVTVRATIDGACHEDWENVGQWYAGSWWDGWMGDMYLDFDGHGGSWSDGCWRGDFLRMGSPR